MARNVVITGCSSGVGKSLALLLANKGSKYNVFATMRNPKPICDEEKSNLTIAALDVTSDESVANFMKTVDRVDILVNNAGYAINGTHEINTMQQVKDQFETNFFGVVRMHNAILPMMRKQKSGHIIGVSSVGGLNGVAFNDIYCASKFALEGLYESMAALNLQLGIQTTLVEPAAIKTAFVDNADAPEVEGVPEDLKEVYTMYRKGMEAAFASSTAQTADEVAEVIVQAIEDGENNKANLRYQTSPTSKAGASAKLVDITGNTNVERACARFGFKYEKR